MSDKLTKFTKAILEDAESVSRGILDGIARERTAALKEVEEQTLAETFTYVKGEVARIRAREGKRLSKAVLDAKRSYFIRRNEITDEVFDALKARIEAFTQTHDYDKKLISFARSVSAFSSSFRPRTLSSASSAASFVASVVLALRTS